MQKVTAGSSHQNANAVWDIYCSVLMQFKTGSLSCSPSPSLCWALINQPLKADVTWIALHTAAIRLHHQCGKQTTAGKFMNMPLMTGRPRRCQNMFLSWGDCDWRGVVVSGSLLDAHRPGNCDWQTLKDCLIMSLSIIVKPCFFSDAPLSLS